MPGALKYPLREFLPLWALGEFNNGTVLITTDELFSDAASRLLLEQYSLQYAMVKDVDADVIVWCNQAMADSMGVRAEEMHGQPSCKFYPKEYKKFHLDDLDVVANGPKLGYPEGYEDSLGIYQQLHTNKVPEVISGRNAVFIFALNLTQIAADARHNIEKGRSYSFDAMKKAREEFDQLMNEFHE